MQVEFFQVPDLCPICSGPTVLDGDFLFCKSKSCPNKLSGSIRVWIRNLGLLHWGDALIDSITDPDTGSVKSIPCLYKLSVEDISKHTSGMKMARKCHDILHSNKSITLELMFASLNIPNFGVSTATDLVQAGFDTVDKIINISFDDLINVPNIGDKTARMIQEGIISKRELIVELSTVLDLKAKVSGPLQNKTVCITLELSMPRKTLEKHIMDAGGTPKSSVSKTTSYLVCNYPDAASSKLVNARKHGVPIISESDIMDIIKSC